MDTEVQTGTSASDRAGRREWIGLAVLALPTLLLALDMSVLYLALPALSADLRPTATEQLWIMDIYGFMIAGFLVTMGTLGDRIGRRRLLMLGGVAFAGASVAAAFAASPEMLILTRALLGVAGATLMPSTLALIGTMFRDEHQRGMAIGVWLTCFMGGMTVGPLVGGLLLERFWWGAAFLLGVPVMVVLLVAAPILLPEHRDESQGRLDPVSVLLSLAAILPIIYGLKHVVQHGLDGTAVAALTLGVGFGVAFVRRQRTLAQPLVDLELFGNRRFSSALGIQLGGGIVMSGTFLLLAQYLQLAEGLSPLQAGLLLVPLNIAMAAASLGTPHLARRFRPATLVTTGLLVAALGLAVVTRTPAEGGIPVLLVGFLLACIGIAVPSSLGINLVVGSAPPSKAGAASALSETCGEFGIACGVAILGSVATAVYHTQLAAALPTEAAPAAGEGLAGAVTLAPALSSAAGEALLIAAREAFASGLHVAAATGSALLAVMAVVAARMFRDEPVPTTSTTAGEPVACGAH